MAPALHGNGSTLQRGRQPRSFLILARGLLCGRAKVDERCRSSQRPAGRRLEEWARRAAAPYAIGGGPLRVLISLRNGKIFSLWWRRLPPQNRLWRTTISWYKPPKPSANRSFEQKIHKPLGMACLYHEILIRHDLKPLKAMSLVYIYIT